MSEPELAYMTGTNDDFDLPRWQPQLPPPLPTSYDSLSSSAQAAQAAAAGSNNAYLYHAPPPPPPPPAGGLSLVHRLPSLSLSASTSTASRPPRIAQLVEQETGHSHLGPIGVGTALGAGSFGPPSPYSNNLARSTSLGGASTRRRHQHHPADDLEGAFGVDSEHAATTSASAQHRPPPLPGSFYPSVGAYQTTSQSPAASAGAVSELPATSTSDSYQDMYFGGSAPGTQIPKRSQTQHDPSTSSRVARSPHRSGSSNPSLLDPYSPHSQSHSPYSPTTASYPYPPPSTSDHSRSAYSHARTQSQAQSGAVKVEEYTGSTIPSPYSPPNTASVYGGTYSMDTSTPSNAGSASQQQQAPTSHAHLSPQPYLRPSSLSTPSSPLGFSQSQSPHGHYYPQDNQAMMVDGPPKQSQRTLGFRRVRDQRDLRPNVNTHPDGRRIDTEGNYLSPLRQLTTNLVDTFHICNPQFRYESAHNPRRVLTKPSKPCHNDGYDNEDYDYILYVNDWLGTEEGHKYLILDVLGQGTFGQVVKCQNMKTHEVVAVKVVKNKPAYFNQSMMEVTILELLNNQCDPNDEHHILRLRDSFIHKNHLCLVFELLSSNLYELIKQNQFQGLSTQLVKVFAAQLLDALTVLKEARLIHCDLKPENILLKSLSSPQIKVIDFGSACHERQTVYTYIQSRFYRSPEVLLGNPYTAAIDMWSLGCIVVELFLGLPLFPGTSEYNQITRIVDMLGMPPPYMLELGKQTNQFFDSYIDMYGQKKYKLKSLEQYSREHNTQEQPGKQYFKHTTLPDIINNAPIHHYKSSSRGNSHEADKEMANRASFIDFCHGLLNLNPVERWTPQQARQHPFITGEKWTGPWQPSSLAPSHSASPPKNATPDPKRPYGGLVPSQPKGQRAYQDAASYNQQLAQHQAYTAQAATQAANSAYARNPYMQSSTSQQSPAYTTTTESAQPSYSQQQSQYTSPNNGHRGLAHQTSHGHLAINTSVPQYPSHGSGGGGGGGANVSMEPGPPVAAYYPTTRARANTVNQIDVVPPALARLRHMTQDVISGRNALTPVLNREDALKEWERRQSGKAAAAQPYPQLEYLHQQAELATSGGLHNWGQANPNTRYHPPGTSKLAQSYHPTTALVDDDRRDAIMSNVRSAARGDNSSFGGPSASNQSYSGSSANRYAPAGFAQQQSPTSPFDSIERRTDIGSLYVPMQPDQYQAYPAAGAGSQQPRQPAQNMTPSFYSGGVVAAGQPSNGVGTQRNPFGAVEGGQGTVKDSRRHSGMDIWPR